MVGFIFDLLTLGALGPPRLVHWVATKTAEEAERELLDEEAVRSQLLELQTRYDLGEIGEEEFSQKETALIEELNAIQELKEQRRQQK